MTSPTDEERATAKARLLEIWDKKYAHFTDYQARIGRAAVEAVGDFIDEQIENNRESSD